MKKLLVLVTLGTLAFALLMLPRLANRSQALSTKPSMELPNPINHAGAKVQQLSVSDYTRLTNWLFTPFLRVNEGQTPRDAKDGVRKLGTNVLPALIALVRGQDPNIARAAGMAINGFGILGPAAAPAVEPLAECLGDPNPDVRATAVECLGRIGKPARSAVPKLLTAIKDDSVDVRQEAIKALMFVPGEADTVVPALVEVIEEPPPGGDPEWVRYWAIAALDNYVEHADKAIPVLRRMTNDPSILVRTRSELLLNSIESAKRPRLSPEYERFLYRAGLDNASRALKCPPSVTNNMSR